MGVYSNSTPRRYDRFIVPTFTPPDNDERVLECGPVAGVDPVLCRQAVTSVLESPEFARAARLSAFLTHICERELAGRRAEINETRIGIEVFGRSSSYNPAEDTIVRTTARLLRQRLAQFYQSPKGKDTPVWIEIPRGGYSPVFLPNGTEISHAVVTEDTGLEEGAPGSSPLQGSGSPQKEIREERSFSMRASAIALAALIAGMAIFLAVVWHFNPSQKPAPFRTPSEDLWALLFSPERETLLVPADSALVMYEQAAHTQVSLEDYLSGHWDNTLNKPLPSEAQLLLNGLKGKRYTAVTSVEFALELAALPQSRTRRPRLRYARDLQLDDLRRDNIILVGVEQNNPWLQPFQQQLNFHLLWSPGSDQFVITNSHPKAGEPQEWHWRKDDPSRRGYAQIALRRNVSGEGYVLILAGTSMAGTQAAMDFLLNPDRMGPVLHDAVHSDGSLSNFEILLQTEFLGNGSAGTTVLGSRIA